MYYPKSQIKTNLYTNGNEYILSTTKENYKGHFYEVSNGGKYTGKSPSDPPNILLTLINTAPSPSQGKKQNNDINIYSQTQDGNDYSILNFPINTSLLNITHYPTTPKPTRFIPSPNLTLPTPQDYEFGEFQRYFAKKNNELRYLEIDKQTYTLLQNEDPTIAWDLYTPITVTWELSGDEEKTYNINKNIVSLAEQKNKWYGFTQWFRDNFLKYYLAS